MPENRKTATKTVSVDYTLSTKHRQELEASCVSPDIIGRYFFSIDGEAAQELLIGDALEALGAHSQQYATAPVQRLLQQSEHVKAGGWFCRANGQIKPDSPRQALKKDESGQWAPSDKFVKYESVREKPYKGAHVSLMVPDSPINGIVAITEGGKKAGCLASLGFAALPLPGVDMGAYKNEGDSTLIPAIAELPRDTKLVITFDQDKELSKRQGVAASASRLARLLEDAGFSVFVASWSHKAGKGVDDICAAKGADFVRSLILEAPSFEQWKKSLPKSWGKTRSPQWKAEYAKLESLHARLTALPEADVLLNQRHLDEGHLEIYGMKPGSALLLDSPMSTQKTSRFIKGIAADHQAKYPDSWGLLNSLRNILLAQTNQIIGFTHWADLDESQRLIEPRISAAAESLVKFTHRDIPAHSLILIDELMSLLVHVFTSDTMGNGIDRVLCVRALQIIFEKVIAGGGWIVGCEAGLNQAAYDCFRDLLPAETPILMVRNQHEIKADQPVVFYDSPSRAKEVMLERRAKGEKLILASDSAAYIDHQMRPLFGEKAYHLSARNSESQSAKDFALDPRADFEKNPVDVFSYSPTLQIGSSIEDGSQQWFDTGFGVFHGVLDSSSLMQMQGRYRTFVPWHVSCKKSSVNDDDLSIFDPEKLKKSKLEKVEYLKELLGLASYLKQYEESSLLSAFNRTVAGDYPLASLIQKWQAIYEAMRNWDGLCLRENLKKRFKARGFEVFEDASKPGEGISELFKEVKESAIEQDALEFSQVEVDELKTEAEAREVLSTHGHSRAEVLEAKKLLLVAEFPKADFNDPEFCKEYVVRSRGKKISKIRSLWAARNPEQAKAIDRWHIKNKAQSAANLDIGFSDLKAHSAKADLLARSGLVRAIDTVGSNLYGNQTPVIAELGKWVRRRRALLKKQGITIKKDASNLEIFNKLARELGYQPKKEKQLKGQRVYQLVDFDDPNREHMLKSLSDKFCSKLEQHGESLDGKVLEVSERWDVSTLRDDEAPTPAAPERVGWSWHLFERDLIEAKTLEELQKSTHGVNDELRLAVMKDWSSDWRYGWLVEKADRLSEVAKCAA